MKDRKCSVKNSSINSKTTPFKVLKGGKLGNKELTDYLNKKNNDTQRQYSTADSPDIG